VKETIENHIKNLCEEFDRVDWSDKRIYAAYCAQIYYYVRHSTRLLGLGAGLMPLADQPAHQRFGAHILEEKNHELLALRDCEALGFRVTDFPELPATKAFYQTQYQMVLMKTPWALLGYILMLEGLAINKCGEFYEHVTKLHGPKCASFMKVHGEEDEDHFPQALKLIESRSPQEREAILESAEMSTYLHRMMLRDLPGAIAGMEKTQEKKAA
jgi:hypothetical protein